MIGDQWYTEALDVNRPRLVSVVGEHCMGLEAGGKPTRGVHTRENADMSSVKGG